MYEFLDEPLCNITNGVHAQATVNIDNARHIGYQILENMAVVKASEYSFKRNKAQQANDVSMGILST